MKYITKDDFYEYSKYKTIEGKKIFPKPKIGKIYKESNSTDCVGRKTVIEIIGIEIRKSEHFCYAYPLEIIKIHIQEKKVYIK